MFSKRLYCVFIAVLILQDFVDGKKQKKAKRTEEEDKTPQANVVTYSTFGFNDVGSYDGFVPSSPDYINNLNQEPGPRLYAPAFPSASESTGFNNEFGTQNQDQQPYSTAVEGDPRPQGNMVQYQQSMMTFFNTPSFENNVGQIHNIPSVDNDAIYGQTGDDLNSPVYGTKLNSKTKQNFGGQFNNTEFNVFSSGPSNIPENNYSHLHELQSNFDKKPLNFNGESGSRSNNYNFHLNNPPIDDNFTKQVYTTTSNPLKFPKVLDFTKHKPYYESNFDNRFPPMTLKPLIIEDVMPGNGNENPFTKYSGEDSGKYNPIPQKQLFVSKDIDDTQKPITKPDSSSKHNNLDSYSTQSVESKNIVKNTNIQSDYKENKQNRPWALNNYINDYKTWQNPVKGYEYSTDFSNTSFKYDFGLNKKPYSTNTDEVIPASSNNVDFTDYQIANTDYERFKKMPSVKENYYDADFTNIESFKSYGKHKPDEYLNTFKSSYASDPATTTQWGNAFKASEYSSHKQHARKPHFRDEINDDVVHIPKKPSKYGFQEIESKPNEWNSLNKQRLQKSKKYHNDWNKEVNTRFKSEEDLLGLRNHDTSQAQYFPSYKPVNDVNEDEDSEYKKLIEKWRQSYWKSKFKDAFAHDFDSYPTNSKLVHVPVPKPYQIEVPHPVIVPVPQPYPVRIPVPKPVAVPVIRELTVPIEKPVPYPVFKDVPYPIEKLVPVPVEKQVAVPVMKPYPVPVPQIRTVFHHSRPLRDEYESDHSTGDDDDYHPRPEANEIRGGRQGAYAKRPRSTRNRTRRPSRNTYQERNRRRWPTSRPIGYSREEKYSQNHEEKYPQRPNNNPSREHRNFSPRKYNKESEYDQDHSDYHRLCKRTGYC